MSSDFMPMALDSLSRTRPSALAAGRYQKFRTMGANALRKERS